MSGWQTQAHSQRGSIFFPLGWDNCRPDAKLSIGALGLDDYDTTVIRDTACAQNCPKQILIPVALYRDRINFVIHSPQFLAKIKGFLENSKFGAVHIETSRYNTFSSSPDEPSLSLCAVGDRSTVLEQNKAQD